MVDKTKVRIAAAVLALGAAVVQAVQAVPAQAVPAQAVPAQAVPAQAVPAQAVPAQAAALASRSFTLPEGAPTPGAGFLVKAAYRVVVGVQTYSCDAATLTWATASVPQALLKAYGAFKLIHHYEGPRWTALDGSTVLAAVTQRVPKDGTIPWLLLEVTKHENTKPGPELDDVAFISRVNTAGGVGPTGACEAGSTRSVRYGADYVFWAPASA